MHQVEKIGRAGWQVQVDRVGRIDVEMVERVEAGLAAHARGANVSHRARGGDGSVRCPILDDNVGAPRMGRPHRHHQGHGNPVRLECLNGAFRRYANTHRVLLTRHDKPHS